MLQNQQTEIVEQKLGIPPDYQLKAINSKNFFQANWHKNKLLVLSKLITLTKQTNVLDLGMGSGNFEFENHGKVNSITCVDYNSQAIDFLQKQSKTLGITNLTLINDDIRNLASLKESGKYDLIILIDVIEHIRLEEAHDVVKELKRLLNTSGKIVVITPNYKSLWLIIEGFLDKLTIVPKFAGEQHLSKYYKQNLNELFEKAGFVTTTFCSFNLFSYVIPFRSLSKALCLIEMKMPFSFGNLICGVYQKKDDQIKVWNEHYSNDQEQLYKNSLVKMIFDKGHKFIAKHSANKKTVLDIGSGMGYHLNFEHLGSGRKYICLDSNEKMLEKITHPVTKIVASCDEIPLENNSVDAVIASHILEHVHNLDKTLIEVKRVLTQDGKFLVVLPCDPGFLWKIAAYLSPSRKRLKKQGLDYKVVMAHEHVNTFKECKQKLTEHFVLVDEEFKPFWLKNYNFNLIYCAYLKKA